MKFGKLNVLVEDGKSNDNHILWKCLCECGEEYTGIASRIRNGYITRCRKCAMKAIGDKNSIHKMRNSLEYSSWLAMKDRCLNKNSKDFSKYGGAGIQIFDEWIDNFQSFFEHIGEKKKGESIDRIDNSKGYFPGNVRWASRSCQQRNKRNSLYVDWNGKKLHINDVADELKITRGAAHLRYKRGKLYG